MCSPMSCGCTVRKVLFEAKDDLKIVNAEKRYNEGSSFIVYNIQAKNMKQVKRRYSEFESFRNLLVRLYPLLLIPPIPEKHSLVDYTSKDNGDISMIEKRKRMLERFLLRMAAHPVLSRDHFFHLFMDDITACVEILQDWTKLGQEPSFSFDLIKQSTASWMIKDTKRNRSDQKKGDVVDRTQKGVLKRLSALSNDYSDLGLAYNALSLYEPYGSLSRPIERLGQVMDDSCMNTRDMTKHLESECVERVYDYVEYHRMTQKVLSCQQTRQAELALMRKTIQAKQEVLDITSNQQDGVSYQPEDEWLDTESIEDDFAVVVKQTGCQQPVMTTMPETAKPWPTTQSLFSAVGLGFQTDTESGRQKEQLIKLEETIEELQEAEEIGRSRLERESRQLEEDLARVKKEQTGELKRMLIEFAKAHRDYCEQVKREKQIKRRIGHNKDNNNKKKTKKNLLY